MVPTQQKFSHSLYLPVILVLLDQPALREVTVQQDLLALLVLLGLLRVLEHQLPLPDLSE